MPATHMNRILIRGWLLPLVALAAGLVLGKSGDWIIGAALAVLLIGSVMVAVHHAELVALWLGEPYGTLVLTLAVTIIELSLIVSLMLTGDPNPGLVRDTVLAVVMLVLNGLAGICIVAGTLRHREQEFQTLGANAFLAVLMPMAVLVLVLPNYTLETPGPYYSKLQLIFVGSTCFALYLVFLFVQTVRHQDYFVPTGGIETEHADAPSPRIGAISGGLLVLSLVAVILLAKLLAPFIERSIAAAGAPFKLAGVIVAAIVLLPEFFAALRAAQRNQLQTSINLALGSAVACIGLTVPAVTVIAIWLGQPLALGIDNAATVLLVLSFTGRHAHLRPGPHEPAGGVRPSGPAGELHLHDLRTVTLVSSGECSNPAVIPAKAGTQRWVPAFAGMTAVPRYYLMTAYRAI